MSRMLLCAILWAKRRCLSGAWNQTTVGWGNVECRVLLCPISHTLLQIESLDCSPCKGLPCELVARNDSCIYVLAREGGPPAKDPPNSHTPPYKHIHKTKQKQYIQTYIQAYLQAYLQAILTSIYIKQSIPKSIYIKQSRHAPPKQHPKKQNSKNILPYIIVSIV